jgi:hypothetical protein
MEKLAILKGCFMGNEIYDVTGMIISEDKLICAFFDGREGLNAIMIVKISEKPDKQGVYHLDCRNPDGEERVYWLDKFGLLSSEEMDAEVAKLADDPKRRLLNKLTADLKKKG